MPITQHDRDRIEDLGLDPGADQTEELCSRNAKTPAATGASLTNNHPSTHLKGQS